jgi:hypothetical protein
MTLYITNKSLFMVPIPSLLYRHDVPFSHRSITMAWQPQRASVATTWFLEKWRYCLMLTMVMVLHVVVHAMKPHKSIALIWFKMVETSSML